MGSTTQVTLDVNGFFDHMVGEYGLSGADLDALAPRVVDVLKTLSVYRKEGRLPFYGLPYDDQAIRRIEALAGELRSEFDTLVVLGIGGSALGTRAVLDAIAPAARAPDGLDVLVLDNIDPLSLSRALDGLKLKRTVFNVISKSGSTVETMSQFMVVRERLEQRLGKSSLSRHFVFTTDPEEGLLRQIASEHKVRSLPVPEGVGGRFSVLSAVGLLPVAAAGIDIRALCHGARTADLRASVLDVFSNPAALHAALLFLARQQRGASVHVLMPYSDRLMGLAEWYGQLWAESLGKRVDLAGREVMTGQTPVRALGATDQHSQVQLYVEGPRDKVVTFFRIKDHGCELRIPGGYEGVEELEYLSGHDLGELLNMEQRATELALCEAGRLNSSIVLAELGPVELGELFHMFEVQTLVMGGLLGIDPLNQPGVEAGKDLTRALAGCGGSEASADRVRQLLDRKRGEFVLA